MSAVEIGQPAGPGRSRHGRRDGSRRWQEWALNIGAVAGLLCIGMLIASYVFSLKPLVVRSGSMAPTITTGSLIIAKSVPVSDVRIGDIVTVDDGRASTITHRVVAIDDRGGQTSLTLRGDANSAADPSPYTVTEVQKKVLTVPGLGYVVAWLSSGTAIFLGGVLSGVLLTIAFRPGLKARRPEADEIGMAQEPAPAMREGAHHG